MGVVVSDLNSFYFHDSNKGSTHGCTEVESEFFDKLLDYRSNNPQKKSIDVMVIYPNKNHNTNEINTERSK